MRVEKAEYDEPNIYKILGDETIASFKVAITSLKRSLKHYDQFGMPLYSIEWSLVSSFEIPKALWRKEVSGVM